MIIEERCSKILKQYEDLKENRYYKDLYNDASKKGDEIYASNKPEDLAAKNICIQKFQTKFNNRSFYPPKKFITMNLTCKSLCEMLKLDELFGETFWQQFNSPTEVLMFKAKFDAVVFLNKLQDRKFTLTINKKAPANKFETDVNVNFIRTVNSIKTNTALLLTDVQGAHHKYTKTEDAKKMRHCVRSGIPYVQIKGTTVKNNYSGTYNLFLKLLVYLAEKKHGL